MIGRREKGEGQGTGEKARLREVGEKQDGARAESYPWFTMEPRLTIQFYRSWIFLLKHDTRLFYCNTSILIVIKLL